MRLMRNQSPACTVQHDLPPEFVDGRLRLLVELLEPDTFSTWFGKIRLDVKLFNDFNLAIEIPYLF